MEVMPEVTPDVAAGTAALADAVLPAAWLAVFVAALLLANVLYSLRLRYRRDWLGDDMTRAEASLVPLTYIPALVIGGDAAKKRVKTH